MMKIRSIAYAVLMLGAAFMISCGGDDDSVAIPPADPNAGSDGLFVTGSATSETPEENYGFQDGVTDAFGETPPWAERTGLQEAYMELDAGEMQFSMVEGENTAVYGGTVSSMDTVGDGVMMVIALEADGPAINVANKGLYHVMFDMSSMTAYVNPILTFGVIGPAAAGWSTDTELALESSDNGTYVYKGNVPMRKDYFKFRYNSNWSINRTAEANPPVLPVVEGLNMLSNFGTTTQDGNENGALQPGGYDFLFAGNEANYDITLTISPGEGISASVTLVEGDPLDPITFDPDSVMPAFIGSATPNGWDGPDHDFDYKGQEGDTYTWIRTIRLAADSAFKIRGADNWDGLNLGVSDMTITGTAAGLIGGTGDALVEADADMFYLATLTTSDEGDTYTLQLDSLSWGIIGDATPGGWDNSTEMAYDGDNTWTVNLMLMASGEYKFRVNNAWDYDLGTDLSNLVRGGTNLSVSSDGTYDVTLTSPDGGDTYSATVQ